MALDLARLDELQQVFSTRAFAGDVASLVAKIIERRCVMLGLYTPPTTTLQVIEAEAPKETNTQRLAAAIDRFQGRLPKPDEPHDPEPPSQPH